MEYNCRGLGKVKNRETDKRVKEKQQIVDYGTHIGLIIKSNKFGEMTVLFSHSDLEAVLLYRWGLEKHSHTFYCSARYRSNEGKMAGFRMHRYLMGFPDSKIQVDHKDANGLNNTRGNLRLCSQSQNNYNCRSRENCASKYKGVSKSGKNRWRAYVTIAGKYKCIGYFATEDKAAMAYNEVAKNIAGQFLKENVIKNEVM